MRTCGAVHEEHSRIAREGGVSVIVLRYLLRQPLSPQRLHCATPVDHAGCFRTVVRLRSGGIVRQVSSFLGYTQDHELRIWGHDTAVGILLMGTCLGEISSYRYITHLAQGGRHQA